MCLERSVRDGPSGHARQVVRAKTDDPGTPKALGHLRFAPQEIFRRRKGRDVPRNDADKAHDAEPLRAKRLQWSDHVVEMPVHLRVGFSKNDSARSMVGRKVAAGAQLQVPQETFANARLAKAKERLVWVVEALREERQRHLANLARPPTQEGRVARDRECRPIRRSRTGHGLRTHPLW